LTIGTCPTASASTPRRQRSRTRPRSGAWPATLPILSSRGRHEQCGRVFEGFILFSAEDATRMNTVTGLPLCERASVLAVKCNPLSCVQTSTTLPAKLGGAGGSGDDRSRRLGVSWRSIAAPLPLPCLGSCPHTASIIRTAMGPSTAIPRSAQLFLAGPLPGAKCRPFTLSWRRRSCSQHPCFAGNTCNGPGQLQRTERSPVLPRTTVAEKMRPNRKWPTGV